MSQLDLREKLKIKNVRKGEWADNKGSQWARAESGNHQNRAEQRAARVRGEAFTLRVVTESRVPLQQIPFCCMQQNWEQAWFPRADSVAAFRGHDVLDSGKASASLCLGHERSLGLLSHVVRVTPVRPVSLIATSALQAPDTCTRMVGVEICTRSLSKTRPKVSPGGTQGLLNSKSRV